MFGVLVTAGDAASSLTECTPSPVDVSEGEARLVPQGNGLITVMPSIYFQEIRGDGQEVGREKWLP